LILLSQAELAPTEIIFIDPDHVGATFGCDNEKRHCRQAVAFVVFDLKLPEPEPHQHS
jgi:hypothetical protein